MSHWYDSTPKKSRRKRDSNPGSSALEADALPLGQRGGPRGRERGKRTTMTRSRKSPKEEGKRTTMTRSRKSPKEEGKRTTMTRSRKNPRKRERGLQ